MLSVDLASSLARSTPGAKPEPTARVLQSHTMAPPLVRGFTRIGTPPNTEPPVARVRNAGTPAGSKLEDNING